MNKNEFIREIAGKTGQTIKDTETFYEAFVATVAGAMKKKEEIRLVGFGSFVTRKRAAKNGVNPATGKAIKIPAAVVPALRFGKSFKERI